MARAFAEAQPFDERVVVDPYLYLANVKAHLADHKPMTQGDEDAWWLASGAQDKIIAAVDEQEAWQTGIA
jgi:hypothetical protein